MAEDSQVAYSNGYENGKSASAAELSRLQAEIAEAREIIGAFYTQVSIEGQRHFPHALTTRARAFLNREKADG